MGKIVSTVSNTYTLAFLANHPTTKDIVYKHLRPILYDDDQLNGVHGTLEEMLVYNMGGGIPYDVITALMAELDKLPMPLDENPILELAKEIEERLELLTKEDWKELEGLYKRVLKQKGSFYKVGGKRLSKHVVEMPYAIEAHIVKDVRCFFYDKNLVIPFDWGSWDEGRTMLQKQGKNKFNDLILSEVIKLFTAIIRNDRFCEGAWAEFFESGDAAKLLKRMLYFKDERYPEVGDWLLENMRLHRPPSPEFIVPEGAYEEAERAILENPDEVLGKLTKKDYPHGKKT